MGFEGQGCVMYQEEGSRNEDLGKENRNRELLQTDVLQPGDTTAVQKLFKETDSAHLGYLTPTYEC